MAETILGVVTETVFTKAIQLVSQPISRVWGVYEDLQTLAEKLQMIQALLSDAARKEAESSAVRLWLKKLRAVAIDADNLLDRIAYEGLRKKIEKRMLDKVRNCFTSSNPLAFRFEIAKKIRKINLELDEVIGKSSMIELIRQIGITNTSAEIRMTHPYVDDTKFVGRRDDIVKIVEVLTCSRDGNDLAVIGIVGMAGQGKTAIAQQIYQNEKVSSYFEKRIWVCVSEDFKVENILNDMVQTLTRKKPPSTNRQPLVEELKKELSGKRFLLVLDDVWNEKRELWDCMRECLQEIHGLKGSKLLTTTRSEGVVSTMQASFTHHLGVLSNEDSWTLFEKIAFPNGGAVETLELVNIGKRIVKRCGGVPLAIKTLGGLMYSKKCEKEWSEIEEKGIRSSSSPDAEIVQSAIKLSYDHLPLSLKQCFTFCALFKKDSVLERERLVQLWMAQGLLNSQRESQLEMEDIGNNHFKTLLHRSLLQDAEFNDYGNIKSCKMHDLVHDFALQVSKGYCLNMDGGVVNNDKEAVHLSITGEIGKMSKESFQNLQTLMLTDCDFGDIKLVDCKYLRILVLDNWNIRKLPNSIEQLQHLRYLDIENTCIDTLPHTVTKLYQLQTLRVLNVSNLPENLGNMVNLRHVYIAEVYIRQPPLFPAIENLTSLRTLPYFAVGQDRKFQIGELSKLQNLGGEVKIYCLENVRNKDEAIKAKLSSKKDIECLELHWDWYVEREGSNDKNVLEGLEPHSNLKVLKVRGFAGENLPPWMVSQSPRMPLRNLVKIQLGAFHHFKDIPPLGHLPYLKFVEIRYMRSLECIGSEFYGCTYLESPVSCTSSAVAFPSLQCLDLSEMENCEHWSDAVLHQSAFPIKVFPNLQKLTILDCPKLMRIPDIFKDNHFSLRCLDITECNRLASVPDGLSNLTSLEELSVPLNCVSWVESLCRLTNLRSLTLMLHEDDTECFPWPSSCTTSSETEAHILHQQCPVFGSLEYLCLDGYSAPKLKSLPEQIQCLPSLRDFRLSSFPEMEVLPEWLGNISSLETLRISYCDKLAYLPSAEAMRRLTNLYNLDISSCRILTKRCKEGERPEWHKIAHIPRIAD